MKYTKILLAVDDSPHSEKAAKTGFDLAQKLNAEVGLVYAVEIIVPVSEPYAPVMPTIDFTTIQNESANKTLTQLALKYGEGKNVVQFHPQGTPKEEILATAYNWGADIIVMGTHGRTGFGHLILGSISEYIIRHSKIPVLVVPLNEEK